MSEDSSRDSSHRLIEKAKKCISGTHPVIRGLVFVGVWLIEVFGGSLSPDFQHMAVQIGLLFLLIAISLWVLLSLLRRFEIAKWGLIIILCISLWSNPNMGGMLARYLGANATDIAVTTPSQQTIDEAKQEQAEKDSSQIKNLQEENSKLQSQLNEAQSSLSALSEEPGYPKFIKSYDVLFNFFIGAHYQTSPQIFISTPEGKTKLKEKIQQIIKSVCERAEEEHSRLQRMEDEGRCSNVTDGYNHRKCVSPSGIAADRPSTCPVFVSDKRSNDVDFSVKTPDSKFLGIIVHHAQTYADEPDFYKSFQQAFSCISMQPGKEISDDIEKKLHTNPAASFYWIQIGEDTFEGGNVCGL